MEWLKKTTLKNSLGPLVIICLVVTVALAALLYVSLGNVLKAYPASGVMVLPDGEIAGLPHASGKARFIRSLVSGLQGLSLWLPVLGLNVAMALYYRWKLKPPIDALREGVERIRNHDLDFTIPEISEDELGQVCAAFETMRAELLKTNRELWRQMEERKRLNAAFAHDLRNPVTVLKGTVKQLRRGEADEGALERLEAYTLRIEHYVEAMSGVQRLEELRIERKTVELAHLRRELEETAALLAPGTAAVFTGLDKGAVKLDHSLFLTVAENLIGNAARFTRSQLTLTLTVNDRLLRLAVEDDGPGYPAELARDGPKPFGKFSEEASHFGMGLYTSRLLCRKHGGDLQLRNCAGALAVASFEIYNQA